MILNILFPLYKK